MRLLLLVLFFLVNINCDAQGRLLNPVFSNPFDTVQYEFVVAFVKNNVDGNFNKNSILKNGEVNMELVDFGVSLELLDEQVLIAILVDTLTYGEDEPSCFLPEIGFVFYDSDSNIVGVIDVSLNCNHLSSNIVIPAECYYDYSVGEDIEGEMIISMGGFSRKGKVAFEELIEKVKKSQLQKVK